MKPIAKKATIALNILITILLFLVPSLPTDAFGPRRPTKPVPPTEPPPPPPNVDPPPSTPVSDLEELIKETGKKIDTFHGRNDLLSERISAEGSGDHCQIEVRDEKRFMGRISHYINEAQNSKHAELEGIADIYNLRSNPIPVSLHSHPMCQVTKNTLRRTLKNADRVPSQNVINKLNQFASNYNIVRNKVLNGEKNALLEMNQFWAKLMGCLAYKESLTTANSSTSNRVANKYAPRGYRKPAGVKFYEDPHQSPESRLNIGLFQFTPNSRGNVRPCINKWNKEYPNCQISKNSSQGSMIEHVGSSKQNFNSFCGVDKVLQSFYVQTNTLKSRNTHPSNAGAHPQDRCVSLHFYAGYAYNHFGPFQNTTGKNLESLMDCSLD